MDGSDTYHEGAQWRSTLSILLLHIITDGVQRNDGGAGKKPIKKPVKNHQKRSIVLCCGARSSSVTKIGRFLFCALDITPKTDADASQVPTSTLISRKLDEGCTKVTKVNTPGEPTINNLHQ